MPLPATGTTAFDACALALAPRAGDAEIDLKITGLQQQARDTSDTRALEQLGWAFVEKARVTYDAGYYRLAESCARCIELRGPRNPDALLLKGHALNSLHEFKEAEAAARELVSIREVAFDYALLGDAIMEQGRLGEAIEAYQKMLDLKPGPQSFSRAAHARWLKGDLKGAIEIMREAVRGANTQDRESAAWMYGRLALYELQAGDVKLALGACAAALRFQEDYAPALLARSRALVAQGKADEAIQDLKRAVALNPLPEYLWALADTLGIAGRADEARSVEDDLNRRGAAGDPRSYALYLATRGEHVEVALELVGRELKAREDVFTLDAFAWSLAAAGRTDQARSLIARSLAEGTEDARLFYHAGVIAVRANQKAEARRWLKRASAIKQMLLPSEREGLRKHIAML
jgi:tetratricopeptide (TPR) repeat protein